MNSFRECVDVTYENGTFQTNKIAKNIGLCLRSITECKCRFLTYNLLFSFTFNRNFISCVNLE